MESDFTLPSRNRVALFLIGGAEVRLEIGERVINVGAYGASRRFERVCSLGMRVYLYRVRCFLPGNRAGELNRERIRLTHIDTGI